MAPVEILTPAVALLAFVGYVWLLSSRFWVAMVLTFTICYLIATSTPFDPEQIIYWATGTGLFAAALLAMSLLPPRETFVIEVRKKKKIRVKAEKDIVVDGTDVIFWGGYPSLNTLRAVVDHLREQAVMPYVFFDASSRHMLRDALLDEEAFAKALGLKRERVMVCPNRSEADGFILEFAKRLKLPIITNDHFEDRPADLEGLKLVKGIVADGHTVLETA